MAWASADAVASAVIHPPLGSQVGTLRLGRVAGESGWVTAPDWARDGRVEVAMTTLDAAVADVKDVALVKLDVEGWQCVLEGAVETLARTHHVLIEINGPSLRAAASSPAEVFELRRDRGFSRFRPVARTGLRRLHRSPVSNVLASR